MNPSDESISALREALKVSPTNIPLRKHLAESLLRMGRLGEAEKAYHEALAVAPHHVEIKLGLAHTYHLEQKNSEALVIVEDLIGQRDTPPEALLMHARLLLRAGEVQRAAHQYREAIDLDPSCGDSELAEELGIQSFSDDDDEVEGRRRQRVDEHSAEPMEGDMERPSIAFDDVGGMEPVKEEIRMKIILPMMQPDLFKAYGKKVGGGILLYGPPGCGKTFLSRATAGEVKAGFLAVGISDVLDMWIGNSEKNLHELFEQARRNKPCVMFFDEVDALGASRADMRQTGGRHLINQFLAELDGVQGDNEGLLILAATNAPWHLDNAFRRPGRFDRILFVPPPDPPARAVILRLMLAGKPADDIDFDKLAKKNARVFRCRPESGGRHGRRKQTARCDEIRLTPAVADQRSPLGNRQD